MKRVNRGSVLLTLSAMLAVMNCTAADLLREGASRTVEVKSIIGRRDCFFGRSVAVRGYLVLDFENINLYQSRKDFRLNNRHCVTVGVNDFFQREGKKHNHKVVVVRGLLKKDYVEPDAVCLSCCSSYAILPDAIGAK